MSRTLTAHTLLRHDDGSFHSFGPGDKIPAWAEKQITNPDLWTEKASDTAPPITNPIAASQAIADAAAVEAAAEAVAAQTEADAAATVAEITIPPKAGAGSSADAWREYAVVAAKAADLNIDIPADAGRNDIIEALTAAGIKTE